VSRYRALGADLPWADPRRAHGVAMEGYYWRLFDPGSSRCIVVLCGVCRDAGGGSWAVVAAAAHPGGFVRWANAGRAWADPAAFGAAAWDGDEPLVRGSERRIAAALGEDARLEAVLEGRAGWGGRGLGVAHLIPGLPQYWHPVVLSARLRGEAVIGGSTFSLDGWEAYVEKNWGGTFPGVWWWGQAGFGDGAMAAFAGGRLGGPLAASAVVLRAGGSVVRLAPPGAIVRASTGGGEWRLCARSPRWDVTLEGAGRDPHILPVPVPAERRAVMRSEHHLGGSLRVVARRGRRVVLRAESAVAGLELGTPAR
jgi:hypothetical protein